MLPFALIISFLIMEFVAWLAHKYLMHGVLWKIHKDHHQPSNNWFEKNDFFFLIFAIPSWLCIMLGMIYGNNFSIGFGFGIALYGLIYFLIHDVLIHRRFKWFDKTKNRYFIAVRKAHKVHHKNRFKEAGECFGMLIVPLKYFKQ
ncbi:MAG: sterol desaturase family protein [Crocinitomicaceae bacterium]